MVRSKINTTDRVIIPAVRWRNISLIVVINIRGIVFHETITNYNVNSNIFCEFLKRLFQKLEATDIEEAWFILYKVNIHKTQEVRDLVQQTRRRLVFLPCYYPMINPTVAGEP